MAAFVTRRKMLSKQQVDPGDAMSLAGENRWFFQNWSLMSDRQTYSLYNWLVNDMKTAFDFMEDTVRDLYVFVTVGPQSEMVERVVRDAFPCWTHAEVVAQAQEAQGADTDARIVALRRLAAVAPEQVEPADLALYEAALSDPDSRLRYAGIEAAGYAEWPALVDRLRRVQAEDADGEIRLAAMRMLRGMADNAADQRERQADRREAGW